MEYGSLIGANNEYSRQDKVEPTPERQNKRRISLLTPRCGLASQLIVIAMGDHLLVQ